MSPGESVAFVDDPGACGIDLRDGIRLRVSSRETNRKGFPTDALQKGLTLEFGGRSLVEEGVGFGVPVLKKGLETVFPGSLCVSLLDTDRRRLIVEYHMNLVERLALRRSSLLKNRFANSLKEATGLLHRTYPIARGVLTGISNAVRTAFGIRTVFEQGRSAGIVRMEYRFDPAAGEVVMAMDATGVKRDGLTELIVMNEQGANHFTEYVDSDGLTLHAQDIGSWFPVAAAEASFRDPRHGIRFTLRRVAGVRLFRGRELVKGRLAWAGFAYVLPPGTAAFRCSVVIGAHA